MEDRIKRVMSTILGVDEALINENTSPSTVKRWDSLKHMNLILAIEEEFEIKLSDEDIIEMLNFKLICMILKQHIS